VRREKKQQRPAHLIGALPFSGHNHVRMSVVRRIFGLQTLVPGDIGPRQHMASYRE
jgi:hypothetical protein